MSLPHPLLRWTDTVDILGVNGDRCRVSGPGMGDWGPELARNSTGLFDAPFKTNWGKGMLGSRYESWSPARRDIVATFHIMNPVTGDSLEADPDVWHLIHSRFRALFGNDPDEEATVIYGSHDGERTLGVRMLMEAKSFSGGQMEGRDPHLMPYGTVMLTLGCENPYYVGPTERFAFEVTGTDAAWFRLPYYNPSTIMTWNQWYLTDQARWILPDYSFGWEEYGRGVADRGKTVRLPLLAAGENLHVDCRPDTETLIAENEAPVGNRMAGRDMEYPILAGAGSSDPDNGCVVRVDQITNPDGARCELLMPRWYSEPFSSPLVV